MRWPLALTVFFGKQVSGAELARFLAKHRAHHTTMASTLTAFVPTVEANGDAHVAAVLSLGRRFHRLVATWIAELSEAPPTNEPKPKPKPRPRSAPGFSHEGCKSSLMHLDGLRRGASRFSATGSNRRRSCYASRVALRRVAFLSALWTAAGLAFLPVVSCGFDGTATSTATTSGGGDGGGADAVVPDADAIFIDPVDGGPELTITSGAPATLVDLEQEGTLAWIHWGTRSNDTNSFNQKASAVSALPTFTVMGSTDLRTSSNYVTTFTWTNGTPTATQGGTRNFVYVKGRPTVHVIRVVDVAPQRFVIYAGLFKCKALLTVTLGTGPDARTVIAALDNHDNAYARYVIDHRAKEPGTPLAVTWELVDSYDQSNANVTLAAATLAPR